MKQIMMLKLCIVGICLLPFILCPPKETTTRRPSKSPLENPPKERATSGPTRSPSENSPKDSKDVLYDFGTHVISKRRCGGHLDTPTRQMIVSNQLKDAFAPAQEIDLCIRTPTEVDDSGNERYSKDFHGLGFHVLNPICGSAMMFANESMVWTPRKCAGTSNVVCFHARVSNVYESRAECAANATTFDHGCLTEGVTQSYKSAKKGCRNKGSEPISAITRPDCDVIRGNTCYFLVRSQIKANFTTSEQRCSAHQGTIALPSNYEESQIFYRLCNQPTLHEDGNQGCFVNVRYSTDSGTYVFRNGSSVPLDLLKTVGRRNNNNSYGNKDCLMMNMLGRRWSNFNCSFNLQHVVCQKELENLEENFDFVKDVLKAVNRVNRGFWLDITAKYGRLRHGHTLLEVSNYVNQSLKRLSKIYDAQQGLNWTIVPADGYEGCTTYFCKTSNGNGSS